MLRAGLVTALRQFTSMLPHQLLAQRTRNSKGSMRSCATSCVATCWVACLICRHRLCRNMFDCVPDLQTPITTYRPFRVHAVVAQVAVVHSSKPKFVVADNMATAVCPICGESWLHPIHPIQIQIHPPPPHFQCSEENHEEIEYFRLMKYFNCSCRLGFQGYSAVFGAASWIQGLASRNFEDIRMPEQFWRGFEHYARRHYLNKYMPGPRCVRALFELPDTFSKNAAWSPAAQARSGIYYPALVSPSLRSPNHYDVWCINIILCGSLCWEVHGSHLVAVNVLRDGRLQAIVHRQPPQPAPMPAPTLLALPPPPLPLPSPPEGPEEPLPPPPPPARLQAEDDGHDAPEMSYSGSSLGLNEMD